MRSSSLCMMTIGAMPLVAFAATIWLSDGAPFKPYGAEPYGARAPTPAGAPAGVSPATPLRLVLSGDPDWDRLRRLADRGNTEAALLLATLDHPHRRAVMPVR